MEKYKKISKVKEEVKRGTNQTVFLVEVEEGKSYTMIGNSHLKDTTLSLKARGLLDTLLSKPLDWKVIINALVNELPDGKSSIRSGLEELIEKGYVHRMQIRDVDGKFGDYQYKIFDIPVDLKDCLPNIEKPKSEDPKSDNQTLQSKYTTKTNTYKNAIPSGSNLCSENFLKGSQGEEREGVLTIDQAVSIVERYGIDNRNHKVQPRIEKAIGAGIKDFHDYMNFLKTRRKNPGQGLLAKMLGERKHIVAYLAENDLLDPDEKATCPVCDSVYMIQDRKCFACEATEKDMQNPYNYVKNNQEHLIRLTEGRYAISKYRSELEHHGQYFDDTEAYKEFNEEREFAGKRKDDRSNATVTEIDSMIEEATKHMTLN